MHKKLVIFSKEQIHFEILVTITFLQSSFHRLLYMFSCSGQFLNAAPKNPSFGLNESLTHFPHFGETRCVAQKVCAPLMQIRGNGLLSGLMRKPHKQNITIYKTHKACKLPPLGVPRQSYQSKSLIIVSVDVLDVFDGQQSSIRPIVFGSVSQQQVHLAFSLQLGRTTLIQNGDHWILCEAILQCS